MPVRPVRILDRTPDAGLNRFASCDSGTRVWRNQRKRAHDAATAQQITEDHGGATTPPILQSNPCRLPASVAVAGPSLPSLRAITERVGGDLPALAMDDQLEAVCRSSVWSIDNFCDAVNSDGVKVARILSNTSSWPIFGSTHDSVRPTEQHGFHTRIPRTIAGCRAPGKRPDSRKPQLKPRDRRMLGSAGLTDATSKAEARVDCCPNRFALAATRAAAIPRKMHRITLFSAPNPLRTRLDAGTYTLAGRLRTTVQTPQ